MNVYVDKSTKTWYLLGAVVLVGEEGVHWKYLVVEKTRWQRN